MWTLKIRVREKWNVYNANVAENKIKIYFYSQRYYEEENNLFLVASGIVEGKEQARKRFFNNLKKERKVVCLEHSAQFFICVYSEKQGSKRAEAVKTAYNPKLIFLKPVIIDEQGWEEWEIAALHRTDLAEFIKQAEKLRIKHKVLYFKQQKIENCMVQTVFPNLTEKQKKAFNLAIEQGYYGYPHKITLKKLSNIAKISLSTYQFHLAKAEAKVMPFLAR